MRCGEQCFVVTLEKDGQIIDKKINARTPVQARKIAKEGNQQVKVIKVSKFQSEK